MSDANAMFTAIEVAKRWHISRRHVLDLIHTGELDAINISQKQRPCYRIFRVSVYGYENRKRVSAQG